MDIQPTIDNQQMLPKGTVLHGTYRIERYLASGGFGNTYVATNEFDEQVVIKEFFMRGVTERGDDQKTVMVTEANAALFRQQRAKFVKEAKRMRTLNNPHVVRIHALFEENETAYYVMDYIDGQSLSAELKQQGHPYTEKAVVDILQVLADALQAVHAKNIQHLDIKPGNIMRDRQGNIFLIDFGASKQIGADGSMTTTTTSMCYTPGYAPVEQMDQRIESIGAWTDIYALGATVYNLLTQQKPPLPSDILLDGSEAFSFPDAVSPQMRQFVTTCMNPSFRKRPHDVKSMLDLLPVKVPKIESSRETFTVKGVSFDMIRVEGGTYWMGAQSDNPSGRNYDKDADSYEGPVHQESVSTFYMGETEVTQELWQAVMGENPSYYEGSQKPVEQVSWNDCQTFIKKLNSLTGRTFRLPTEAEWEYAARGGNQSKGYKYAGSNSIDDVAWYDDYSPGTHPVKQKAPNELGLYDMSGNVCEWTSSYWRDYNASEDRFDRVVRGGCGARVSSSNYYDPDGSDFSLGLRLVLAPPQVTQPARQNRSIVRETKTANGISFEVKGVSFDMIRVEGGTYWMGAQSTNFSGRNYDKDAESDEAPVHQESVSTFYMGETEVTQELWQAVMGTLPSVIASLPYILKGPKRPVCFVSWDDCQTFIKKLNTLTGRTFRLPTEAEWEYAARGGNQSKGYQYSGSNSIDDVAWNYDNSSRTTHPVKQKAPNELGLYDMSGNVNEWTGSYYRSNYNASEDRSGRVYRGGSWNDGARYSRVSGRRGIIPYFSGNDMGLRLALDL